VPQIVVLILAATVVDQREEFGGDGGKWGGRGRPRYRDGCDGFSDMEMLATEYINPRNMGYLRIVGKIIWENPSHHEG
jgi:hypothetical protein